MTEQPIRAFYSPTQAAALLGCTPAHVRRLIAEGSLVAANIGATSGRPLWVIPRSELVAMLRARGLKDLPGCALALLVATDARVVATAEPAGDGE